MRHVLCLWAPGVAYVYLVISHVSCSVLLCWHLVLDVKSRVGAVPPDASEYLAPVGGVKDKQFDWWSKFYASLQDPELKQKEYDELKLDKLVVS